MIEAPATSWATDTIDPGSLEISIGGPPVSVMYGIKNLGSDTAPPPDTFFVARVAKRNATDTSDEYVSFIRFPIHGAEVLQTSDG